MGDSLSNIRDGEEDERRARFLLARRHKEECKETWDKFLKGEAASPLSDILEYAQDLDKEVKTLRQQVEFADQLRKRLKMFLNVR